MPINILTSKAEKIASQASNFEGFSTLSLIGIKEKVSEILSMIGTTEGIFSTYTRHDITHVNKMLDMLDWLIPESTKNVMTPLDWLLIVLSIYFHDLGMVVTKNEFLTRMDNMEFRGFFDKLDKTAEGRDYLARTNSMTADEKDRFFFQEFIRKNHATRIRNWISGHDNVLWDNGVIVIKNAIASLTKDLPSRFLDHLGLVCESHHMDSGLEKEEIFPLCQRYGNTPSESVNIQYTALILRTVDLLHVTKDRTPSIMYQLMDITDPKGIDEWDKQLGTFAINMINRKLVEDDPNTHVITISADFSEERPFFVLSEYIYYVNKQIARTKDLADKSQAKLDAQNYFFPWHTFKGDIRVAGNEPKPISFELDKGRLLNLLVGHTLYNDPTVSVRELLQNAIDAVRFQHLLDLKNTANAIMGKVNISWNNNEKVLTITDNGTGMDLQIIKNHLLCVGSSYYDTLQFNIDYPEFVPISRFGIGILTCFMISDDIEIITKKGDIGYRIKMTSVQSQYLLKELKANDQLLSDVGEHGTKVVIKIRDSVDLKEKGILDIVKYWVILPCCEVLYSDNETDASNNSNKIGFNNLEDALRYFYFDNSNTSSDEIKTEINTFNRNIGNEEYSLSYAVYKKGFSPEKTFLTSKLRKTPCVCVEGIRVANSLPGFSTDYSSNKICALLSVKNNRKLKTTVSRDGLEEDDEYTKITELCADFLIDHIKNEVQRISNQTGEPLSQASTCCNWLIEKLRTICSNNASSNFVISKTKSNPRFVCESFDESGEVHRSLISKDELENIDAFWTIESRLVDSLGTISRDLGKELSLNTFIQKLSPELHDSRINPLLPDAYLYSDQIKSSHFAEFVEFDKQRQQTLIKWAKKTDKCKNEDIIINQIEEYLSLPINRATVEKFLLSERYSRNRTNKLFHNFQICEFQGNDPIVYIVRSRIATLISNSHSSAIIVKEIKRLIIELYSRVQKSEIEKYVCLYSALDILNRYIRLFDHSSYNQGELIQSSRYRWTEVAIKLNEIFSKENSAIKIPENFGDIVGTNKNLFDIKTYWTDWFGDRDQSNLFGLNFDV